MRKLKLGAELLTSSETGPVKLIEVLRHRTTLESRKNPIIPIRSTLTNKDTKEEELRGYKT